MIKIRCIECGEEFEKKNNSHKICSKKCIMVRSNRCSNRYYHERGGKEIAKKYNFSEKRIEYRKNYKRTEKSIERQKKIYSDRKEKKLCPDCGINEVRCGGYGPQVYCEECHKKNLLSVRKYTKNKEKRFEIQNCLICGIDIRDIHPNSKYCLKCRQDLLDLWSTKKIRVKEAIIILSK